MVGTSLIVWLSAELLVAIVTFPTIVRLLRSVRPGLSLDRVSEGSEVPERISVVIPARNEEDRLGPLLESLHSAVGVFEVIVVDDESTDETTRVALEHHALVVDSRPRPSGWVGKTWALHQGIVAARGEWIVSLDADTRVTNDLPTSVVAFAESQGATLTSVAGSFECPTLGAQVAHPSLLTTLIYRFGRPAQTELPPAIANGQCMVFRRDVALSEDFMGSVKHELVEDVALARHVHRSGGKVVMVHGEEFLRVRMFEDFSSTIRGWGRSIAMASVERPIRLVFQLVEMACAQVLPIVFVVSGVAPVMGLVLLAIRVGTLVGIADSYQQRKWSFWLSPMLDVLSWSVIAVGVIRHFLGAPVKWRGRSYAQ